MPLSDTASSLRQPPTKASTPTQQLRKRRVLLLALATAALLWLCYFPIACGWLIWIALVPLLFLVRSSARPRWIYFSAWFGSWIFYLAAMQWMRVADPRMYATWIGLAFYCSFYFLLSVYLIRLLDRCTSLPLVLTVPLVWTAVEFLRATLLGGFAWYMLGHALHTCLPLIQIADLTGVYGVSFLVAAVNALLFEILWNRPAVRSWLAGPDSVSSPLPSCKREADKGKDRIRLLVQGLVVFLALTGTTIYGFWRLGQNRQTPGPRLALIQGNLDQRLRNDSAVSESAVQDMARHFRDLADLAAVYRPDLIIWPETSWPYEWLEEEDGPDPHCRAMAEDMAAQWSAYLLVGMNSITVAAGQSRRYNSAVLIDRQGKAAGRYDKIHRVPFGEYVPFRDWLPWMNYFAPYDFDYSIWPGEHFTRFELVDSATGRRFTFGTLICYEDTDAEVARPYGGSDGAAPADFLVNISNDGWFDGTSEHDEHLAICRFRAVECRRSIVRSVNMGISAVLDSDGRVLQPHELPHPQSRVHSDFHVWAVPMQREKTAELPISQWHRYKKVAGVLLSTVPLDDRVSLYARWGNWLPYSCWVFLMVTLLLPGARRNRVRLAVFSRSIPK